MTQGFMNCGSTNHGFQCMLPCDSLAWYRQLEVQLRRGLPGCQVKMSRVTSRGGRTVTTAQRYETRVRRANAHVIITDLTICDLRGVTSSLDEVRVTAGWESLLRRVLAERSAPALVHVESWAAFSPMGPCRTNATAHRLHLPLARRYGVPVTSFMLGVCAHHPDLAPRLHWRGGCAANASTCGGASGARALDTPGFECEPHPGPHTHRVFAMLLAELMLGAAKRAAHELSRATGSAGVRWPLPRPQPLDLDSTPTVMPESIMSQLSGCRAHHGVSNPLATLDFAEGGCGKPLRHAGWRCYEDRPGKPGWISEDGGRVEDGRGGGPGPATMLISAALPSPPLSFSVPLGSSKLTVAYLRSYDARMGVARVWLDDDDASGFLLNGSWASRTSQTEIRSEGVRGMCGSSCKAKRRGESHTVHVQRISGLKFKLLLLEVC